MADTTYYIDEDVGQDVATQAGTQEQPYKTLGFSVLTHGETPKFLTRKSVTGEIPEGADASARLEWKPVAKAAMKKAVNFAKAAKKKAEKEQGLREEAEKKEADRKKVLDEAKKIVLEEDKSLPAPVKIKLDETDPEKIKLGNGADVKGTRVRVFGRVHRERRQKENMFVGYPLFRAGRRKSMVANNRLDHPQGRLRTDAGHLHRTVGVSNHWIRTSDIR